MTRRNTAAPAAPRTRKQKATRPSSTKASAVRTSIMKKFGAKPVLYGDSPPPRVFRYLQIDAIKVEPLYQRDFRLGHAQKIASNFDLKKMGTPLINERDGELWCVDGQHVLHAIGIINSVYPGFLTRVECEMAAELGVKEEAALFVGRNAQSKVPTVNTFKANHTSGDPDCIRIASILRGRGISVKGMKKNDSATIGCVTPVCWAYKMGVLEDSIDVIKATYGLVDKAFQVHVFHPVAALLAKNKGRISFDLLVRTLSRFTTAGLLTQCHTPDGRGRTVNIANFIAASYNRKASKAERIELIGGSDIG